MFGGRTLFSREIENYQAPRCYTDKSFKRYDGRTDPVEHVHHFEHVMALHRSEDALLYKIFPTTFEGPALSWFMKLEASSIYGWYQFVEKFKAKFVTSRKCRRFFPHFNNPHATPVYTLNLLPENKYCHTRKTRDRECRPNILRCENEYTVLNNEESRDLVLCA